MGKSNITYEGLVCVQCQSALAERVDGKDKISCANCKKDYPVVNGIPIIINESESVFSFADFVHHKNLFFDISKKGKIITAISKIVPTIGGNNLGKRNFNALEKLLSESSNETKPKVLVIGGSIIGDGMQDFVVSEKLAVVESDVSFGPQTKIVFDAHIIPYQDQNFDCVVVQAVLEHVVNPFRCVDEIWRVLKPNGLVYAETPFMQQVHGGPYDFTRFTRSGHRKLFLRFEEIKSGATAGSATSLAWSYQYFLLALFGHTDASRLIVKFFARFTGFWIKYLDYFTKYNTRDLDGASGFYFMGRKSDQRMNDKSIIKYYSSKSEQ